MIHFYPINRKKHQGVALITALLVVSLATIMAVALTSRQYIDIRRTGNMMQSDQAYLDAIAAETFVGQLLANFRSSGQSKYDDIALFNLGLAQLSNDMSSENRLVSLQAVYPEAKFNVNTLVNDKGKLNVDQKEIYRRLLRSVIVDLGGDTGQLDNLVFSLVDWIDEDEEANIAGAEDSVYQGKTPPYKTANRILSSISELRLVEGYTSELLEGIPANEEEEIEAVDGLLAYVDALPDIRSKININGVVKPKIIEALSSYMELNMAVDLLESQPFKELSEFKGHKTFESIRAPNQKSTTKNNYSTLIAEVKKARLETQSLYFLVKSNVVVGKTVVILNSLLYVSADGAKLEVISRAIGTDGI